MARARSPAATGRLLGLESCQLCWDVHKGYASLPQGPDGDSPAGEQVRCARRHLRALHHLPDRPLLLRFRKGLRLLGRFA